MKKSKNTNITNYSEDDNIERVRSGTTLGLLKKEERTEKVCLAAVRREGGELKFVENQTDEICLAAVEQNGYALEFVKNQTDEICFKAIKNCGAAVGFAKKQTEDMWLAAIKSNWKLLGYVKNQTEEMCLAAVSRSWMALEYVENQTDEICWLAIKNNYWALEFVRNQTNEMIEYALKKDISTIVCVDTNVYQYNKNDIIKAFENLNSSGLIIFKKTCEILSKLSDEDIIKAVNVDLKEVFTEKNLKKSEELFNMKSKVDMLSDIKCDINNVDVVIATNTKRKIL